MTPTNGATATAMPYQPTAVTPIAASSRQNRMRTTPSAPSTTAYDLNRPEPLQMPFDRWVGA